MLSEEIQDIMLFKQEMENTRQYASNFPPKGRKPSAKNCAGCEELVKVKLMKVCLDGGNVRVRNVCKIGADVPNNLRRCPIGACRVLDVKYIPYSI